MKFLKHLVSKIDGIIYVMREKYFLKVGNNAILTWQKYCFQINVTYKLKRLRKSKRFRIFAEPYEQGKGTCFGKYFEFSNNTKLLEIFFS